jgi:hypothetical protein
MMVEEAVNQLNTVSTTVKFFRFELNRLARHLH